MTIIRRVGAIAAPVLFAVMAGGSVFSSNLTFTGNRYTVNGTHAGGDVYDWFAWNNEFSGWPGWKGFGHDLTGTFTVG